MNLDATAVNICAVIVASAGIAKGWYLAKGRLRPAYWLMIIMGVFNFVLNGIVVIVMPDMWGILSFQFLILWAIAMGIKGLLRLRREEKFEEAMNVVLEKNENLYKRLSDG